MKKINFLIFLFLALFPFTVFSYTETTFYVSTEGNDQNPGTFSKPFLTILKAKEEVRKFDRRKLKSDIVIQIRGGQYFIVEPIIFKPEDGGFGDYKIIYTAYNGEKVLVSSGVKINGWKKLNDKQDGLPLHVINKVWVADLPVNLGLFRTLYSGVERLPRARSRNVWENPMEGIGNIVESSPKTMVKFPSEMLRNWPNITDLEIAVRPYNWTVNILPLSKVDLDSCILTTKIEGTYPNGFLHVKAWARVNPHLWIENALDFLDEPGEWVVDTQARKVYLYPTKASPENLIAPSLKVLFKIEGENNEHGNSDKPVKNLVFRGLTFKHADRDEWTPEDKGIQHDWEMLDKDNALVRFRGAENCVVENCTFAESGGNAIRFDLYAQKCRVSGCEIRNMGLGGIMMLGYGPGTKDVNKDNEIVNNHIHHCGELMWHSHGIVLFQSGRNRIAHNYIHHMPRKAICLTGVRVNYFMNRNNESRECARSMRWNEIATEDVTKEIFEAISVRQPGGSRVGFEEATTILKYLHTRDNLIEYNEVEHCLEKLSDGAAINVSGAGTGNKVLRNYIHDINGDPKEQITACLRTDDCQWGTLFAENVIANSRIRAFEHKCVNDIINNVIVNVGTDGVLSILDSWGPFGNSRIEKNIFLTLSDNDPVFYRVFKATDIERFKGMNLDNNIYFNLGKKDQSFTDDVKMVREQGLDLHSLAVDPMLVDWKNGNFCLMENSPAKKLGIISVDISKAGLIQPFQVRK